MVRTLPLLFSLALGGAVAAQHGTQQSDPQAPMYEAPRSDDAGAQAKAMQLPDGFTAELIAAEPDVCNVVAFTIDDHGRFYVCETFRVHDGVFDDRSYMQWLDADLACRTVADRLAKYDRFLGAEKVASYATRTERIRMLADTDGNGSLDRVTVFAGDFDDMADGVAAGVLEVDGDVFATIIPKVWRLRDDDGDGRSDRRSVVHDGFGVHTSLMGHDMHGLIVGPDRRLYFSIGDRGFHVETPAGALAFPDEGAVLRCELDGSDLEVVHRGLRNPQELAFDEWGDLFTGDNNSDGGDRARLVQVLPGADSGWRIGFQWMSDRGQWNREKMWHPRHPAQTAAIVPPICNFADGPSGLVYDTGYGLPERFRGCFFLCDFRGSASYSGVRTFRLSRSGAGFELRDHDKLAWNVLAPDVTFGPDGALYLIDWVHGWTKTGKGRIWRLRSKEMANDFQLRNTARLLASDLTQRATSQLGALLAHADRRVRQKAQFALVDVGGRDALLAAATSRSSRVARMHGIWGLGVLARTEGQPLDELLPLLDDDDADVRAMVARVLGDARHAPAAARLAKLLRDDNSRVKREAAFALQRLGRDADAHVGALFAMLRHDDDRDAVLRHAAVCALAATATEQQLVERADDGGLAVQRGVLLALAKQRSAEVARFLTHGDEQLRFEAARAIYETPIDAAMRPLALLAWDDAPDSERIDRRAISANRVIGQVENCEGLIHLALQQDHPDATRLEALAVVGEWHAPSGRCRLTGNWRPCTHEDPDITAIALVRDHRALLRDPVTAAATARAIAQLHIDDCAEGLRALLQDDAMPADARTAALDAIAERHGDALQAAIDAIDERAPVPLRKRAIELLSRADPAKAVPLLASLLANGPVREQQAALVALGDLDAPAATDALRGALQRTLDDDLPVALQLELREAAGKHDALTPTLRQLEARDAETGVLGPFLHCLDGGDAREGRKVFFDFEATRCTRCHTLDGTGGNAGPVLDGIGSTLQPRQLLEALVTPSARIADGFQTTLVELHDDSLYSGVITRDQDGSITIVDIEGKAHEIAWQRIRSRKANAESAMPKMGESLSKRQLRDLLAFLQQRRK